MSDRGEIEFLCPDCRESFDVNESMRAALIDHGCVLCGADITLAAFTGS